MGCVFVGDIPTAWYEVANDYGTYGYKTFPCDLFLMDLDGKATLGALAGKTGLTMGTIREVIANLLKLGLIEKVEKEIVPVGSDFFRYLLDELALAIGPIASVLIEDEVQDLGYDVNHFPNFLVTELVDRLAGEIRRKEKKAVFIKNMVSIIRAKGYANA